MDTGSLLLIIAITILTGLYVARPFFEEASGHLHVKKTGKKLSYQEQAYLDLLEEKDGAFSRLQELDVDFSQGKVQEDDYPLLRSALVEQASETLKRVEQMDAYFQSNDRSETESQQVTLPAQSTDSLDAIEEMIAARRRTREEKSAGFCPHCGKAIRISDLYCPGCGNKVV